MELIQADFPTHFRMAITRIKLDSAITIIMMKNYNNWINSVKIDENLQLTT